MSKELVEYIAKSLVDHPDEVGVDKVDDELGYVLKLSVAESDLGKIIGKGGRTAKSIRSILSVASAKSGDRILLKIME